MNSILVTIATIATPTLIILAAIYTVLKRITVVEVILNEIKSNHLPHIEKWLKRLETKIDNQSK